jgi:hypothetical protein
MLERTNGGSLWMTLGYQMTGSGDTQGHGKREATT